MSKRLIASAFLTACLCWLCGPAAYGQFRPRGLGISRPSEQGPSYLFGRTGGFNTGRLSRPLSVSGLGDSRAVSGSNFYGAVPGLVRLPPAPIPQAFTGFETGYRAYRAPQALFESPGGVSNATLSGISGLSRSMSPAAPLIARTWELKFPYRPYYVPEPEGTAFHEFFGLEPPKPEVTGSLVETVGMVGALAHTNEELIEQMKSHAEQSFKVAMTPNVQERESRLWEAQQRLTALREVDKRAFIPSLLAVHTSLDRELTRQALYFLVDAVVRNPSFFAEPPALAPYYGDYDAASHHSNLLEQQMRENLQIGERNPQDASAYALQAYCAWMLNDQARIKQAMERMEEAARQGTLGGKALTVRDALAAAMK